MISTDVSIERIKTQVRVFFGDPVAESAQQNCCALSRTARSECHKALHQRPQPNWRKTVVDISSARCE